MDGMVNQRKNFWLLLFMGAVYFAAFILPNATGAKDEHMLFLLSNDETVCYPYVLRMLTPGATLGETWGRLIIYGDYHYGYPFYFLSMLVLLPVRLLAGEDFRHLTQLNLLLLRQFISVLPIILSAGILTYLQTRFRSTLKSALIFLLILSLPGLVRNNLNWWHPDALAVLAVVLCIYFLDLDRLRFGKHFYLAAVFCGLASAIKLTGFFFGLTIAGYLLAGIRLHRISFRAAAAKGLLFILVMLVTIVVTNPFLFYSSQREKMITIQASKMVEFSQGYRHDVSPEYQKGVEFWEPTLTKWYAPLPVLGLMVLFLLSGCLWGKNRPANLLMLGFLSPYSAYLILMVAIKPDHYWLPVMLPLFSAALNPFSSISVLQTARPAGKLISALAIGLVIGILVYQFLTTIPVDANLYLSYLEQERALGY